ncbi:MULTISPECIES: ABC transporter permease [unclassified Streptomyces]|uniref:ABC transporter permease n=1 Tax=unclassified Streptomyces TaxID=2593676 RepID=UPI0006F8CF84|nr:MULTISPECIES: ABC transporter permease [unclassified Streptomyces]KQX59606.1 ABC transporter permease [Streptomyces sp. Root1304]KRB00864.1 ABC transporter permease [Streptomyces sp. Root66D1]
MTTTTLPEATPDTTPRTPGTGTVTLARVVHSEWHKLRTLRSSWITVLTAAALVLGVGVLMGTTYTSDGGDSDVDTVVLTLYGSQLGAIALAVLGILVTAGEYATGTIRATLTAVPTRLPVLWAKAAVFTGTVLTVTFVTNVLTFLAAQVFLSDTDQAASLTDDGVLAALAGNAVGLTLLGLIALGLGAGLRSVPGAIGAFVGGVLIVPEILGMLPYGAMETAVRYFPTQASGVLGSATPLPDAASPGAALLALLLWAAVALVVPALLLKRRDV